MGKKNKGADELMAILNDVHDKLKLLSKMFNSFENSGEPIGASDFHVLESWCGEMARDIDEASNIVDEAELAQTTGMGIQ